MKLQLTAVRITVAPVGMSLRCDGRTGIHHENHVNCQRHISSDPRAIEIAIPLRSDILANVNLRIFQL
jgi:hypothetical protein